MRQRFMNPRTGEEVPEPMGQERGMRGFGPSGPKKPVMKPGSRPTAHHPHRKEFRTPKPPGAAQGAPGFQSQVPAPGIPPGPAAGGPPAFDGNWIQGAIKHPGALHEDLGVPQGQKIPAGKLSAAASKGGTLGKRARLAETLKGLHHDAEESPAHEAKESAAFEKKEHAKRK